MNHPFDAVTVEVPRDQWGKPLILQPDGKTRAYHRASSLGKCLEDDTNLVKWKQRMTLVGATLSDHILISASAHRGDKRKLDDLVQQAMDTAQASSRAEIGTALHTLLETIDSGGDPGKYPDKYAADVKAYQDATSGWEYAAMEKFVVCDALRAAGSLDRLMRLPDGRLRVVDLKTGSSVEYATLSFAVQMAVYANGEEYDPRDGTRFRLGDMDTDVAYCVHLPAGEGRCDVYEVDIRKGYEAAKLALQVRGVRYPSKSWWTKVPGPRTSGAA